MDAHELRSLREQIGITQGRTARDCQVDRIKLSLWECDLADLKREEVQRIESYLHAALEEKLQQLQQLSDERQAVNA